MFEYSLAHYIAQGSPIYLQARWQGTDFFSPLAQRCFPNVQFHRKAAFLGPLKSVSSHFLVTGDDKGYGPMPWRAQFVGKPEKIKHHPWQQWSFLVIDERTNGDPETILPALEHISPQIDAIVMGGFFIDGRFPRNMTLFHIPTQLRGPHQCCCTLRPEPSDLVLHFRAMSMDPVAGRELVDAPLSWYHRVLSNLTFNRLWIVAQPYAYQSGFVRDMRASYPIVTTLPHDNVFQALCFIQQATTFIASATSTISQMGAFLALERGATVFMPVRSLTNEAATAYDRRIHYRLF
jgi:hypothetical protein